MCFVIVFYFVEVVFEEVEIFCMFFFSCCFCFLWLLLLGCFFIGVFCCGWMYFGICEFGEYYCSEIVEFDFDE